MNDEAAQEGESDEDSDDDEDEAELEDLEVRLQGVDLGAIDRLEVGCIWVVGG